jgi:L-rhamnose mutarotase
VGEDSRQLKRYAFMLRLRPGVEAAYEESHRAVWPEMLELLKRSGISEYSIYRRGRMLILVLRCRDFEETWSKIDADPVNISWQKAMAPFFAPVEEVQPGERFAMLEEIFYLP